MKKYKVVAGSAAAEVFTGGLATPAIIVCAILGGIIGGYGEDLAEWTFDAILQ